MKHTVCFFALLAALIMGRCANEKPRETEGFDIVGAWELVRIEHPDGRTDTMDLGSYTRCKIYDPDSTYYSIELLAEGDDVYIIPHEMAKYALTDTSYVENERPTPFQIIDDTTMTTVWDGYTEVMHKAITMTEARKEEIRRLVRHYFSPRRKADQLSKFVLSTSERELKSANLRYQYLLLTGVFALLLMAMYFWQTFKQKQQLERQLRELQEIRDLRPQPVTNAMKQAEADFFRSEYYQGLRKRIEAGNNFSQKDWDRLEQELKVVYPDFSTALYQLSSLSAIEYHVCLLTKLRATPTEIGMVLKKESSSISSIRGRLYHKVFGKNGGAKEWDEFILSL